MQTELSIRLQIPYRYHPSGPLQVQHESDASPMQSDAMPSKSFLPDLRSLEKTFDPWNPVTEVSDTEGERKGVNTSHERES